MGRRSEREKELAVDLLVQLSSSKAAFLSGMDECGDNHLEMTDAGTFFFYIEEVITNRNQ